MITKKDRRTLKRARETLRGAEKWLRINRDLLSPRQQSDITTVMGELAQALQAATAKDAASRADEVERRINAALPAQKHPAIRENVEMLLVVAILVMGIRTFFIQPFKIPTGSMQPTLYGIFPPEGARPLPYGLSAPSILDRIAGILFQGMIYEPWGYRSRGDHIFVDKISYHFRRPHHGEVIVFDTSNIPDLGASRGKFYIKRLIGLPADVVQIQPPHVLVNGQVLDSRPAFKRIYSRQNGYNGYVIPEYPRARYFSSPESTYTVPDNHLFVLGDNSVSSLDGRFWGSVPRKDLVGRAVFVYWPFTERFGLVN